MRIEIIKDHKDSFGRNWQKGKKTHVTKLFGQELIKSKVAVQIKHEEDERQELATKLQKAGIEINTK